nr:MAG TPA: hypothetical protein [Caudoviricetes sp.]
MARMRVLHTSMPGAGSPGRIGTISVLNIFKILIL